MVNILVAPVNDAPVVVAQSVIVTEGESLPIILSGSDIDDDQLSYVIVDAPTHGTLFGDAPNLIIYSGGRLCRYRLVYLPG